MNPPIVSTAAFPPVSWFMAIRDTRAFYLEACENYQRQSYRNRYRIVGPNGIQTLSIPVQQLHGHKIPIREVRIDYRENWQQTHWRSITTAYRNSPYFLYLGDEFQPFFTRKTEFLFDWNLQIMETIFRVLKWKKDILLTPVFQPITQDPSDFRDKIHPKLPCPVSVPEYYQVFQERHGFIPDVSVLDLLFCAGISEL